MGCKIPIDIKQHKADVMDRVYGMRREKKYCDFLVQVGSLEIPAHRNILCANSEFFDKMLSHPTAESKSGVVEIRDVDPECTNICIDHMYGEEVSLPDEKYELLMFVATLMQLHTLCGAIITLLETNLDAKSFFVVRRIADKYECKELAEKCRIFAEENWGLLSREEDFGEFDQSFIKKMVKSKNLKTSEDEKLEGLLNWIKYDSKRSGLLMEMMEWIDLSKVSLEYRQDLVEKNPVVFESRECLRLLSSSVFRSKKETNMEKAVMIFDRISGHLQLWNPKTNTRKMMQEMNDDMKKNRFSAVTLGIYIYVLIENKSVYRLKYLDETGTWERMATMIEYHGACPPATVFSDCIYVIGGHNRITSAVEKFNPDENKWTKLTEKPKPSRLTEILTCGEYIYNFGGLIDGKWSNKVERFEPKSSTWVELSPMKVAKGYAAAVQFSDKIYLLGGYAGTDHQYTVEVYDIQDNIWTQLNPMKVKRSWLRGFVIDGHMYAVGGYYSSPGSIEKYDFTKQEWEMVEIPSGMKLKIQESTEVILQR